jgi:pimeloyl-ACP methyl ester carboxylesterase
LCSALGLAERPVALVGYDLGGAVATGFAARYPSLCASLAMIGPVGIKYKPGINENRFRTKYLGEISMAKQKQTLPDLQLKEFNNVNLDAPHRFLVDRQVAMSHWQIKNTPGYLGALLSTFRNFPLRNMEELYTAVGRHNRKVLVMWGNKDEICPYHKCMTIIEESFPDGYIIDLVDCGHNCVMEKFEDVVTELLNFHREVFPKKRH